jgi:hypothetical protein
MPRVIAYLVLSIGIICTSAFADEIRLKNGDRLTGSIIKSDKDSLSMKTEFAGEVKVLHVRCLMYSLVRRILDQELLQWRRRLAF